MNHRYLRAYMAGIVIPTAFLLVVLAVFCVARFVFDVPVPIERAIVFPMALIPNLFGAWNVFYFALPPARRLAIGIHGALLPFVLVPLGLALATKLGLCRVDREGWIGFQAIRLSHAHGLLVFLLLVAIYYLVWKYIVRFLNDLVGIV
jgi:hypothetical protein